jgi:hypothetical protein
MRVLIIVLLFANSVVANDAADLKASAAKWQTAKAACGGDYSYTVTHASWVGFRDSTEIVVRDNVVVSRAYAFSGKGQPGLQEKWKEAGNAIGSHKGGVPAKTLDELYADAERILARTLKRGEKRYLKFDKQGLLKHCFYVDTNIADDAPTTGVLLANLTLKGTKSAAAKGHKSPNGKLFPAHWGAPPKRQTRDLRQLPGGYGRGSGTLRAWIENNLKRDKK